MIKDLDSYLKEKELSWSPKTVKTVRATISMLLPYINGNARRLWDRLEETRKPYSRVSAWGNVCSFWDYLQGETNEENPYRSFRHRNNRLFKNKYVRRTEALSVTDATKLIEEKVKDPGIKRKALELLQTGMRFSESLTFKDGMITGKNDLVRAVFLPQIEGPEFTISYHTFWKTLKRETGLKPHDLRKSFLNSVVKDEKANVFELTQMAGWKNLETGRSYINVSSSRVEEIFRSIQKRAKG